MGDHPHGFFVARKHDINLVVVIFGVAVVVLNAVASGKPEIGKAHYLEAIAVDRMLADAFDPDFFAIPRSARNRK